LPGPRHCWVDGQLRPIDAPVLRADDSAFTEGRGCYTSARIRAGRPRFANRHVERVVRAAKELRLGDVDPALALRALEELAQAAFGDGDGAVRLQASCDGSGQLHLVALARELGNEPDEWSAVSVALPHEGGGLSAGLKVSSRLTMALAGDAARAAGVDEALLFDASQQLVEGARSNILVAFSDAEILTPAIAAGGVAGIARGLVLERVAGVVQSTVAQTELERAAEIVAVNAVRGAAPIVRLDGKAVGDGRPGPWARRLCEALDRD